ncbi:MAG: radical SAM protein [Bacillota bacterium]|nr:radical SAM protein [Bacillota bacterium]
MAQITIGCSHNKCTFCSMYKDKKFSIRPLEEVLEDFALARQSYKRVEKIFLADGDALVLPNDYLVTVLQYIKKHFPECKRVAVYATAANILNKSMAELQELQQLGLGIAYLGLESGSERILEVVKKKISTADMVVACKRLREAGIQSSVTMISGLGGKALWQEHALESAKIVSEMNPDYLGLLTLMVAKGTEIYEQIHNREIELLNPLEVAQETKLFLENLSVTNCVFRSNHASNYLVLKGTLPADQQKLVRQIDQAIHQKNGFRNELLRGL